jgi:hypothetical protein
VWLSQQLLQVSKKIPKVLGGGHVTCKRSHKVEKKRSRAAAVQATAAVGGTKKDKGIGYRCPEMQKIIVQRLTNAAQLPACVGCETSLAEQNQSSGCYGSMMFQIAKTMLCLGRLPQAELSNCSKIVTRYTFWLSGIPACRLPCRLNLCKPCAMVLAEWLCRRL